MDLFTYIYSWFGIVWTGQDSARRSGFGPEITMLLDGQEPAGTVGLEQDSSGVVRKLLHGRLLETVCRLQLIENPSELVIFCIHRRLRSLSEIVPM